MISAKSEKTHKPSGKLSPDRIKRVYDHYRENYGFMFFDPNGPQEQFINHVGTSPSMVSILSAANGVGKTTLVVNALANLIWGPQTKWFDKPNFKDWKFPKRIRYITDPNLLQDIGPFHTEIEKWWPKGRYESSKAGKGYFSQYKANGWIVDVMTYEQAVKEFEGGSLGLIVCDEPPPRSIWHACVTRLRLGGFLWVLMTPLTEAAWFFDEVVPRHVENITYACMEDACKQHGIRGYLEHSRIEAMISEMDPDEVEARAHGKAMYLRGLIYKTFDPLVHVAKERITPPWNAEVLHVVDPHVDKPFAMGWFYPTKDGRLIQFHEWPYDDFERMRGCDLGIDDYKRIITNIEQGWLVKKRVIDRHFAEERSLQTKRTLREDLFKVGLKFEPSYTSAEEVDTGILGVRSYLKYNKNKPIDTVNQPRFIVSPTCKNTIKAMQRWSFDPKTGKIQDAYKDFPDVVRYAIMSAPKVSKPSPEPQYRKMYG